ncbi:MAG: RHS repeat-associated core domain-containing protein [Acidobacteriaceae bacterium]
MRARADYRARYYEPNIGRFLSEDPIRFEGGVKFYGYAGANPINNTDPTGLDYWIEGSVPGEGAYPYHQSVCVGKYDGARYCISFGVAEDNCLMGCKGEVYQDTSAAGPLRGGTYTYWYRYTDAGIDAKISTELHAMVGSKGSYWLLGNNCRDFSWRVFLHLTETYGGKAKQKP